MLDLLMLVFSPLLVGFSAIGAHHVYQWAWAKVHRVEYQRVRVTRTVAQPVTIEEDD